MNFRRRPRLKIPIPFFLFLALSGHGGSDAWGEAIPGRESAILADLDGSGHTWINPARIADSGKGFDVGYAASGNIGGIRTVAQVPGSVAFGYEYASLATPRYYYSQSEESDGFHILSLAKRGFGTGPWMEGLRLGVSLRYANRVHSFSRYGDYEGMLHDMWALDAGLGLDVPLPEYQGRLSLGAYALQAATGMLGPRHLGFQAKWLDPSGWLRLDGSVDAYNPRYRQEWNSYEERNSSVPNARLAAAVLFTHAELGAAVLPSYGLYGPTLDVKFRSWSILRDLGFGFGLLVNPTVGGGSVFTGHLEAKIRFKSDTALARDYDRYRRIHPGPIAPPAVAVVDSASPALDEDQWNRNWALYQEDKIGAWQGVVWPYVNTFGLYTTLYIPAGTNCLAVGRYAPGFALLGGWVAVGALATFYPDEDSNAPGVIFVLGEAGLKLVDWALARRFVKAHNRELRRKYRLGAAPVFQGSAQGAQLSLAF